MARGYWIVGQKTSHNRTVYASPPVGGSAYVLARSIAPLIPTPKLRHILPALVFAAQSPYSGWQNVVNSRNVMRNGGLKFVGEILNIEYIEKY
jgi:hypothetical protein